MKRTFTVVMLPQDYITIFSSWDFETQAKVDQLENKYGEAEVLLHINTDHATELTSKLWALYKQHHVAKAIFKVKDPTKFLETVEGYSGSEKLALGETL